MPTLISPALPEGHLSHTAQPTLSHDDLILRPWRPGDSPIVKTAFDCPGIQRWHTFRVDSDGEALEWIAGWERRWREEKDASWAITLRHNDLPLGQIGLRRVNLFEAEAGVSYWMLPAARGKGIAAQAVRALSGWAFDTVGLHRLSLRHSVANAASCRVATKAGFALEGILRRAARHADGWHDMHQHATLTPHTGGGASSGNQI